MNDDLLDFSKKQDENKPFLSSDPLTDKGEQKNTTPLPPVENTQPQKPQKTVLSPEEIDYSKPENKELARKRANELIDQGKFEEAAKILRDSGMHQTVKPASSKGEPSPQASGAVSVGDVQVQKSSQPQVTASQAPPIQQPTGKLESDQQKTDQPLESERFDRAHNRDPQSQSAKIEKSQPIPPSTSMPTTPDVAPVSPDETPASVPPTEQSSEVKFEPIVEVSQASTPPKPPLIPTSLSKESSQPPSTPVSPDVTSPLQDEAPAGKTPSEIEYQHPDDYLKKAYELRKDLIEYDRTKLLEEEKLQAAEDLVFEGKKEEAIKVYKQVAKEAEEKDEREVAIEAMERLAALLR